MLDAKSFKEAYGPWAVVTGASSGIGAEFARQLGAIGLSVAIVARRAEKLQDLSRDITTANPAVQVKVIPADLSTAAGVDAVVEATGSLDVGLLVNNAGVEGAGAFLNIDRASHQRVIDLNVTGCTLVSHEFAQTLVKRTRSDETRKRRGGIIMLSSLACRPTPYTAVYAGSKAFVTAVAVALQHELAEDRVDVMSLEPGRVESEMSKRGAEVADMDAAGFREMPTKDFVSDALKAFVGGKVRWTPGLMNRVMMAVFDWLPQGFAVNLMGKNWRRMLDPKLITYEG